MSLGFTTAFGTSISSSMTMSPSSRSQLVQLMPLEDVTWLTVLWPDALETEVTMKKKIFKNCKDKHHEHDQVILETTKPFQLKVLLRIIRTAKSFQVRRWLDNCCINQLWDWSATKDICGQIIKHLLGYLSKVTSLTWCKQLSWFHSKRTLPSYPPSLLLFVLLKVAAALQTWSWHEMLFLKRWWSLLGWRVKTYLMDTLL